MTTEQPSLSWVAKVLHASGHIRRIRFTFSPMRIGLARRGYSSTGGAENYLRRLAVALEEAGHQSVLLAGPEWPRAQWPGAGCQLVAGARSPRAFADGIAQAMESGKCDLLFSLERLWQCDCYRAGDGVHRAWLQRRARAEPAWKSWLRRWNPKHRQILALETALFAGQGAKSVIANSRFVRDEIVEHYHYPPEQIAIVYNGLPEEYFTLLNDGWQERGAAARTALELGEADCAILFAGSGWERKGLRHALAAFEILTTEAPKPHPILLVAGRGNPKSYLARMASRVRDKIRFLGPVADMPACYAAADLFVLPTLYDPFSNACLEALAAGLPVITTRANGFGEIMTPGDHGEIVDERASDFAQALATAMRKWLDPERRLQSREVCRQKASAYTMNNNVRQTLEFLHQRGLLS